MNLNTCNFIKRIEQVLAELDISAIEEYVIIIIILLILCGSTHFHIRNIDKIRNLLSYDVCSTISCRLDYCNSILYNVPKSKTD